MANLSYNTEKFTNVKKYDEQTGSYTGLQIASKLNQKNGQDYKLVDIVDIDFDGAWLNATKSYLNTAEDLFNAIDAIGDLEELEWIRTKIDEHDKSIDEIISTYVTQDQLNEILSHYQKPLQAGEHITIDTENIVSTYGLITPEEADSKYATITSLNELSDYLNEYYYDKISADAKTVEIGTSLIQELVIKNADEKYNDLEKVSDFILSLPLDNINNLQTVIDRVDRLDDVVGYAYQDPVTMGYSYTGLLERTYNLENTTELLTSELWNVKNELINIEEVADIAYSTSMNAYDYAYEAYIISKSSDSTSAEAYQMAYYSYVAVGIPKEAAYFSYLTDEQIAALNEDPSYMEVYSIKENNLSGVPQPDTYDKDSGLQYYEYHPEIEATGFYKRVDEIAEVADEAKEIAENSLFRLYTYSYNDYSKLMIGPLVNDGTGERIISVDLVEANIREEDGYILNRGLITSESLYDAFSYAFTPEFITSDD